MSELELLWDAPPSPPALDADVHVWAAALDLPGHAIAPLERTLAADELARAARFRFARDRRRYVVARGTLRALLGAYLGRDPAAIRLRLTSHGKPELALPDDATTPRFNVAHADDLALYAVAPTDVGVDVEAERPVPDGDRIAEEMFASGELAALRSLPAGERADAFLRCWTRKEAFIKALGEGLSCPLDRFEVTLRPDEAARLVTIDGEATAADGWTLADLAPARGFVGALAVPGAPARIRCWRWIPRET